MKAKQSSNKHNIIQIKQTKYQIICPKSGKKNYRERGEERRGEGEEKSERISERKERKKRSSGAASVQP
jgi:hypothetical protein